MLAAVDTFNVVSFWNTHSGKLIHKAILSPDDQIKDAIKYEIQIEANSRYSDPSE